MAVPRPSHLTFVGASENVPREIRGTGKACGGTFAIILVPARQESRLTLVVNREARIGVWTAASATATDHPHVPAIAATGPEAKAFLAAGRDATKAGAATLKGNWTGTVTCSPEHGPQFRFERKIGYVRVVIETAVARGDIVGWNVHAERQKQWFGVDSVSSIVHKFTLREAMITAADLAVDSAREVCGTNVTARRSALDAAYGAAHPAHVPAERKDPIERMNAVLDKIPLLKKEPAAPATRGRKKAPAHPVGSAGELAAAQATATAAASAAVVAIDAATADPSKAKAAAEAAGQALRTAGAVAVHPLAQSAAIVADVVTEAAGHLAPVLQRAMKVGDWKKLREAVHKVGVSAEGASRRIRREAVSPTGRVFQVTFHPGTSDKAARQLFENAGGSFVLNPWTGVWTPDRDDTEAGDGLDTLALQGEIGSFQRAGRGYKVVFLAATTAKVAASMFANAGGTFALDDRTGTWSPSKGDAEAGEELDLFTLQGGIAGFKRVRGGEVLPRPTNPPQRVPQRPVAVPERRPPGRPAAPRPAARPAPTPATPAARAPRAKPAGRSDAEKDAAIMKLITDALRDNIR